MNKSDLQKLINDTVENVAFEYLKKLKQQHAAKKTNSELNGENFSDEDFDSILFHGGQRAKEEKKTGPITIRENMENKLKITTSEIKKFEDSFGPILENIPGASIVFDRQKNGYSIYAVKRPDGVEAKASGIINLGDNGKLIWSYSILNGFNLNAQNLELSDENKSMFELLCNHYNDWQKKWRELLNLPRAPVDNDDNKESNSGQVPNAPQPNFGTGVSGGGGNSQGGPSGAIDSGSMGMS